MDISTLPVLYSFKRCPYAIRARTALAFANIDYIHREINLRDKHPIFLETSPKGTVPVFVDTHNDMIIDESFDIVVYALQTNLPKGWMNNEVLDLKSSQVIFEKLNKEAIPAIRSIKYDVTHGADRDTATDQINQYLLDLDALLSKHRFLVDQPSALDLLVFPNLRQLTIHDPQWLKKYGFASVERWLDCWISHPIFKKVFVTHPQWEENQRPIVTDNQHGYSMI
tara:strand:- start:1071 stop:1745 length:675 start_codon:yes stop_codon:yes gene_type:complete